MQNILCVEGPVPSPPINGAHVVFNCVTRVRRPSPKRTSSPRALADTLNSMPARPLVSVVDDDESVRESLPELLKAFGFAVRSYSSAEEFLASDVIDQTDCLVLDISMPGMTGPELQKEMARRRKLPIIFITAHADDAIRSRVIEAGAIDCLLKPFGENSLLGAINAALGRKA
jgi:FixJ family two-component response regulator